MKHLVLDHKCVIGVVIACVGLAVLVISTLNICDESIVGACALICGNQLAMYDRIARQIRVVHGVGRESWEDGYDFGEHRGRRLPKLRIVPTRRDEGPQRQFFSS